MATVSVSGSLRCWHTCGPVVGLAAGVRSSVFRICGRRKATTWRSKLVTASVVADICDRSIMIALIRVTDTEVFHTKNIFSTKQGYFFVDVIHSLHLSAALLKTFGAKFWKVTVDDYSSLSFELCLDLCNN